MTSKHRYIAAVAACLVGTSARAQSVTTAAPIALTSSASTYRDTLPSMSIADSDRTQIFILGTPHLRFLKDDFRPAQLDALMGVLVRYKPDIIGVESMSATLVGELERRGGPYDAVIDEFAKDRVSEGHEAQKALGLDRDKAAKAAAAKWGDLAAALTAGDSAHVRSQLVLALVAAYDINTALLQWTYVPEPQRTRNDVVPATIAAYLTKTLTVPNEIQALSMRLAHQLGIQRIVSVDDWEYVDLFDPIQSQLTKDIEVNPVFKQAAASTFYAESDKRYHEAAARGNLLPYYQYLNSDAYSIPDIVTQWDAFFKTHLPSGYDRARVAFWEVRNLDIASHIRKATALYPGKKMLMTIGAAHRPFLDAYLSQMMDVKVVRLQDLLPPS